jgi:branched-subunit amino acid aminotransferase/4-amino-4-deoxychorismate lyase
MRELDGQPVSADDVAALALYNYGHFTSFLVEDGRVRGLTLHLARLVNDCRTLFDADLDPTRIRSLVRRAVSARREPQLVRVTIFAPELSLSRPAHPVTTKILVTTRPAASGVLTPLRLTTVRYQREVASVKHVGLFAALHHRRAAQQAGYDDALFIDPASHMSEGPTWNLAFIDDSGLVWPLADQLPGVTMRLIAECASDLGISSAARPLALTDLAGMRSAFISNASVGIRPIHAIDTITFDSDDEAITRLRDAYRARAGEVV